MWNSTLQLFSVLFFSFFCFWCCTLMLQSDGNQCAQCTNCQLPEGTGRSARDQFRPEINKIGISIPFQNLSNLSINSIFLNYIFFKFLKFIYFNLNFQIKFINIRCFLFTFNINFNFRTNFDWIKVNRLSESGATRWLVHNWAYWSGAVGGQWRCSVLQLDR